MTFGGGAGAREEAESCCVCPLFCCRYGKRARVAALLDVVGRGLALVTLGRE